jgi:endogenous inhibitor of DNA gyrase (YacG/DUF329 family)
MKIYNCKHCGVECKKTAQKMNKFCSNKCQQRWYWENVTRPKVESGQCTHHSRLLRPYLIETQGEKCAECGQNSIHNNKRLVLQLDHIDGNSDNNYPSNIRLLCPNCHSQTENFGSKGKGSRYKKITKRNKYLQDYKAGLTQR